MKERAGKDIFGIITEMCENRHTGIALKPYTHNGSPTERIGALGNGVGITDAHPWGAVVKTYLDQSIEYANQRKDEQETKDIAEGYAEKMKEFNLASVLANPQIVKRSPLFVKV